MLIDPYQNILESELSHCPLGEAVTFYYYKGRLAIYTEDYDAALDYFTKAIISATRNINETWHVFCFSPFL